MLVELVMDKLIADLNAALDAERFEDITDDKKHILILQAVPVFKAFVAEHGSDLLADGVVLDRCRFTFEQDRQVIRMHFRDGTNFVAHI